MTHRIRSSALIVMFLGLALASAPAFAGVGGDDAGTCVGACGGYGAGNNANSCYCDSACTGYGDCCADYAPVCQGSTGCAPNSGGRYILHLGGRGRRQRALGQLPRGHLRALRLLRAPGYQRGSQCLQPQRHQR